MNKYCNNNKKKKKNENTNNNDNNDDNVRFLIAKAMAIVIKKN